jgi:DivIVA domain-containing protein
MALPYELLGEVVLAGLVVAGTAMAIVGRAGTDPGATVDAGDDGLPDGPVDAADLPRLRLGLALRGYRMAEVDAFVDRVAAELDRRDALIRELGGDPHAEPRPVPVPVPEPGAGPDEHAADAVPTADLASLDDPAPGPAPGHG